MLYPTKAKTVVALSLIAFVSLALFPSFARAHCDTLGGPVVKDGRTALETGRIDLILKWIKSSHEAEIRAAFDRSRAVRAMGAEARELADLHFLETLVRLHRAGEGAPYTGLKDEAVEPIIALADKALAEGSDLALLKAIGGHLASALGVKFQKAVQAMKEKDSSVEAGREFVEAYVALTHYVEAVHAAIAGAGHEGH